MPPQTGSRYGACLGVLDAGGRRFLAEREPFRYRPLADNRVHVVVDGDTLFELAGRYFASRFGHGRVSPRTPVRWSTMLHSS